MLIAFNVNAGSVSYMLMPIDYIIDADTIRSNFNKHTLPPPLNKISIRIRGIDTPERGWRADCDKEKQLAEDARQYLSELIGNSRTMKVTNFKYGKWGGRIVADVRINGIDIGPELIKKGYAVEYDGGTRTSSWCN